MKHFKTHKLVEWDIVPCPWRCPEEKFCNVEECPNSAVLIPYSNSYSWSGRRPCESVLPRVSKVLHLCFHCIFLVLKVVTSINIGPVTAWGWTLVQNCTFSVRLFSLASKGAWSESCVWLKKGRERGRPTNRLCQGITQAIAHSTLVKTFIWI